MVTTSDEREGEVQERLERLLRPVIATLGYELVRVQLTGPGRRTLQVMVERDDRTTMTVEHCAEVSRVVAPALDAAGEFDDMFTVEVSSPGLDRPLVTLDHFRRFVGFETRIELTEAIDGRRRFAGRLLGVEPRDGADELVVALPEGVKHLPFRAVRKAKLVMNDDLLAAAERWAAAGRSP